MCVMKPASTICARPSFFSVASRSVCAKAFGSGLCSTASLPTGCAASIMAPPRASRSNSPPGRPLCCTCTTGAPASRARPSSRASAASAGTAPGRASLPSRYSFCASMMTSVAPAREGGRRSAPASSNRVLAGLIAKTLHAHLRVQAARAAPRPRRGRLGCLRPPTSLPPSLGTEPSRAARFCQLAHTQDVALSLGDRDDAARVQQIEDVTCLDALIIGRQRQAVARVVGAGRGPTGREQRLAFLFGIPEMLQQDFGVGVLEIEARILLLGLQEHVAVGQLALILSPIEVEVEHAVDTLHVHGEPLEAVGDFARDGIAVEAADLLKVGKLSDLHAIAPHLPAQAPGPQGRALPIVLHEADVMELGVDANAGQACQVKIDEVVGRRLHDDLELIVVLQAIGIFTVAPVLRPARGLHVGGIPGLWTQGTQCRCRMKGARAYLHVIGLQDRAALLSPVLLQAQNQVLERCARLQAWRGLDNLSGCRNGGFLLHRVRLHGAAARALYANGEIGHDNSNGGSRASPGLGCRRHERAPARR